MSFFESQFKESKIKDKVKRVKNFLIHKNKSGHIYSVGFYKRTDGTFRKMVCRGGVYKGLKGGTMKYNPLSRDLVQVYDMQNKGYRLIPCENMVEIKANGVHYADYNRYRRNNTSMQRMWVGSNE